MTADTPPRKHPDWPLPSFDARDWAEAFCRLNSQMDEGTMVAWFANALMRGFDERADRAEAAAEIERLRAALDEWQSCAKYDALMGGPKFMGWNRSALDRCRRKFIEKVALTHEREGK